MARGLLKRAWLCLRRGGTFVHYGGPESLSRFVLFWLSYLVKLCADGKAIKGYGSHRVDLR